MLTNAKMSCLNTKDEILCIEQGFGIGSVYRNKP